MNRIATLNLIRKIANVSLDLTLRASILELVAGLRPNTWSNNLNRFLSEAPQYFPNLAPDWWNKRTEKMYEACTSAANGVLKSKSMADDVFQNLFSKGKIKNLASWLKEKDILSQEGSYNIVLKVLRNMCRQTALSFMKIKENQALYNAQEIGETDSGEETPLRHNPGHDVQTTFTEMEEMDYFLNWLKVDKALRQEVIKSFDPESPFEEAVLNRILEAGISGVTGKALSDEEKGYLGALYFKTTAKGPPRVNSVIQKAYDLLEHNFPVDIENASELKDFIYRCYGSIPVPTDKDYKIVQNSMKNFIKLKRTYPDAPVLPLALMGGQNIRMKGDDVIPAFIDMNKNFGLAQEEIMSDDYLPKFLKRFLKRHPDIRNQIDNRLTTESMSQMHFAKKKKKLK